MGFGSSFILILGIAVWVVVALWPAMIAKRKGYSFTLFLLIAILFSFLISLIIALLLKNKNETAQDRADEKAVNDELEKEEGLKKR